MTGRATAIGRGRISTLLPMRLRSALLALALVGTASAQTLTPLADVDVNAQPFFAPYVDVGGAVVFAGLAPGESDFRLWRTDGTPGGTVSLDVLGIAPSARGLVPFGGRGYFVATVDAGSGPVTNGLFRTTAEGLGVERFSGVTAIDNGGLGQLTPTSVGLYFTACTTAEGCEVWRTEGEAVNLVQDLCPGSCDASPSGFTDLGGTVLFAATDGSTGVELYRALGPGLARVRDIVEGAGSSAPGSLLAWNGQVVFAATGPDAAGVEAGRELWTSAGGDASLAVDAAPGALGSAPQPLGLAGGRVIVLAQPDPAVGPEPYVFDGATLTLLGDIRPGSTGSRVQCTTGSAEARWNPSCAQTDDAFYLLAQPATLDTRLFATDGASLVEIPASTGGRLAGPLLADGTAVIAQTCAASYTDCALERVAAFGAAAAPLVALPANSQAASLGWLGETLLLEVGTRDPVTLAVTTQLMRLDMGDTSAEADRSASVRLSAPSPNPTAGAARVTVALDRAQRVRMTLVDALGRTVATITDAALAAGTHRLDVATDGLLSGVYVVVLEAGGVRAQTRMTVVR